MYKIIVIFIYLLLCIFTNAQEKEWVKYPYREISVDCAKNEYAGVNTTLCYVIQNKDDFNRICSGEKSKVYFSNEIILGVKVSTNVFGSNYPREHVPNLKYSIYKETSKKIIHFMVYFISGPSSYRCLAESWVAIQKPEDDYEIHFHLDGNKDIEIRVFNKNQ